MKNPLKNYGNSKSYIMFYLNCINLRMVVWNHLNVVTHVGSHIFYASDTHWIAHLLCTMSSLVDKFGLCLQYFKNIIVNDSKNTDKAILRDSLDSQLMQKFYYFPLFYRHTWQGLRNCMHSYEHVCKEVFACTKLHARKSIKTPLSSTPMLFKIVSCFSVWKQIIFCTIRSDTHNFLAEKLLLNIVISSFM